MLVVYIIAYVCLLLLAWAIGSVNFAIIIFYLRRRADIRTKSSKNAGGSNVGRILGVKWGILVVVLDMLKVPLTMTVALGFSFITSVDHPDKFWQVISFYLVGGVVILGHIWPIFFRLRGGKGVACFWGLTWVTNPWWFFIFALLWFLFFFLTRKSFWASTGSIACTAICAWIPQISQVANLASYTSLTFLLNVKFIWFNQFHNLSTPGVGDSLLTMQLVLTITAIIVCWKHRSNLQNWCKNYRLKHSQ